MSQQLSLNFDTFDLSPSSKAQDQPAPANARLFRHGDIQIAYQLTRSRRRSIGLSINDHGLRVTAPAWIGMGQIESAIQAKLDWIVRKLQESEVRQRKLATDDQSWQFGGAIPYLGQTIEICDGLRQQERRPTSVWYDGDAQDPKHGDRLWVVLPVHAQAQQIREMTQSWLQKQARHWFALRLQAFEAQCGLKPTEWRLSNAASRWGSCNSQGRIGLNWRLIHFEKPVIDYVIAHELAHLKELNHSNAFWQTLKTIYPDYIQGHQRLKAYVPGQLPDL